jgi:DNA-binding transcriptional MerR regulator
MDDDTRYVIGELARRSGLTVKAVRFYSDLGLVPPAGRSPGGYRLFGVEAVARLQLVRTLRELGLDLATIRRVADRDVPLAEVAAAHAEALDGQIRVLRLRRALLTAIARGGHTPEEMDIVRKLTEDGRRRVVAEFLDGVFGDEPAFAGFRRSMTPELPGDPTGEQVVAWVELAGLAADPDFRDGMRRLAHLYAADRPAGPPRPDAVAIVRDEARAAVEAGIPPDSAGADPVLAAVRMRCTADATPPSQPDPALTAAGTHRAGDEVLLARLEAAADPRRERYFELLSTVNGWPPAESLKPTLDWFIRALRKRQALRKREAA